MSGEKHKSSSQSRTADCARVASDVLEIEDLLLHDLSVVVQMPKGVEPFNAQLPDIQDAFKRIRTEDGRREGRESRKTGGIGMFHEKSGFHEQCVGDKGVQGEAFPVDVERILLGDPLFASEMPPWLAILPMWAKVALLRLLQPPILRQLHRENPQVYGRVLALGRFLGLSNRRMQSVLTGELILGSGGRAGCSVMGLSAQRCAGSGPIMVRAFDLPACLRPLNTVRWVQYRADLPSIQFSLCPAPGCFSGMNGHIAIAMNVALSRLRDKTLIPTSLRLSEALGRCRSTRETVDFLTSVKHPGGASVMVVDRDSEMAVIEIAGPVVRVRQGHDGVLVMTNHYEHQECVPLDRAHDPMPPHHNGPPPILPSSKERAERLRMLANRFADAGRLIDVDDAIAFLRDVGDEAGAQPNDLTLCRRNRFYETIAAMVFLPAQGAVFAASGLPSETPFVRYELAGPTEACEQMKSITTGSLAKASVA